MDGYHLPSWLCMVRGIGCSHYSNTIVHFVPLAFKVCYYLQILTCLRCTSSLINKMYQMSSPVLHRLMSLQRQKPFDMKLVHSLKNTLRGWSSRTKLP